MFLEASGRWPPYYNLDRYSVFVLMRGQAVDVAVVPALVTEEGEREKAAAQRDGEKYAQDRGDDGVRRQGARAAQKHQRCDDDQHRRDGDPFHHALELLSGFELLVHTDQS